MDAKKKYRRRLKLQAALSRVLEVLEANDADGIRPDRTTATLAGEVALRLVMYMDLAGVDLSKSGGDVKPWRHQFIVLRRKVETASRNLRRVRRRLKDAEPPAEEGQA